MNGRKSITLAALVWTLSACSAPPTPIIDMAGVDPVQYNRDLAECVRAGSETVIAVGNPVTRCMAGKNYKILVGY